MDGCYYHHRCPDCGADYHDPLPMLICVECHSKDVAVTFDQAKRERELRGERTLFEKGNPHE